MITFNEYLIEARKTAVYSVEDGQLYVSLGLINEIGEVAGKFKKVLRGDGGITLNDVAKELGDVLWYIAGCVHEFDLHIIEDPTLLVDVFAPDNNTKAPASYITAYILNLSRSANRFVDSYELYGNSSLTLYEFMTMILTFITLCNLLNTTIEVVARQNLEKLSKRMENGTIKGSGDER